METGRNHEGYKDPTCTQALTNIAAELTKFRPIVYIACPFSDSPDENMVKARRYCRFAIDKGAIPVCPVIYLPQFMSEETERDLAARIDNIFLCRCAEVWVMGGEISPGMQDEIALAKERQKRIRYFNENLEEVGQE